MPTTPAALEEALQEVARRARESGVFGPVTVGKGRLECSAKASAEPAFYRLEADQGRLWVSLVMKDRWLSESIESDLMHTGDSLEELIEEELAEQECPHRLPYEHYRSDDKLFTFRSPVPVEPGAESVPSSVDTITRCLLAYEACFRRLGDMDSSKNEG